MNCDTCNNLLSEYIDGVLPEREREHVRKHLAECPDCRETYESISAITAQMRETEAVTEPEDFVERVTARIEADSTVGGKLKRFLSPPRIKLPLGLAGAAAALLIIVYAAGFFSGRDAFQLTVLLEAPREKANHEKKSGKGRGEEKSERDAATASALRAVIDSLDGTVIESSRRDGTGLPALFIVTIKASQCDSLLRKCEELGILLESSATPPDAGDRLVTVNIVIRYRDAAP